MGTEVVAAIFTAIGAVAAAAIAIIPQRSGWRARVKKDLDNFYRLIPLTDSLSDSIILNRYRRHIFASVEKGVGSTRKPLATAFTWAAMIPFGLAVGFVAGIPLTPASFVLMLASMAAGWLIGYFATSILAKHPKTERNPFYKSAKDLEAIRSQVAEAEAELTAELEEDGWISNYLAYLAYRRTQWGPYLHKQAVREDGDAAKRKEGCDKDVGTREPDKQL